MGARKVPEKTGAESCCDPEGDDVKAGFEMNCCRLIGWHASISQFGDDFGEIDHGDGGRQCLGHLFMARFPKNEGEERRRVE